jgi:hypothetical protein
LEKAPDAYQGVLTTERRAKGDMCTTENLQEAMNDLWRNLGSKKKISEDNTDITVGEFMVGRNKRVLWRKKLILS